MYSVSIPPRSCSILGWFMYLMARYTLAITLDLPLLLDASLPISASVHSACSSRMYSKPSIKRDCSDPPANQWQASVRRGAEKNLSVSLMYTDKELVCGGNESNASLSLIPGASMDFVCGWLFWLFCSLYVFQR